MNHTRTILSLDPGTRDLGYAVLAGNSLLDAGTKTFRFTPRPERHRAAFTAVRSWIERFDPDVLVLERTPGNGQPTFRALRRLEKAIRRLARARRIGFVTYSAQTVRKALLGNGWGSKRDAAVAMAARYPVLRIYLRQTRRWKETFFFNTTDAVALGLHHYTSG